MPEKLEGKRLLRMFFRSRKQFCIQELQKLSVSTRTLAKANKDPVNTIGVQNGKFLDEWMANPYWAFPSLTAQVQCVSDFKEGDFLEEGTMARLPCLNLMKGKVGVFGFHACCTKHRRAYATVATIRLG